MALAFVAGAFALTPISPAAAKPAAAPNGLPATLEPTEGVPESLSRGAAAAASPYLEEGSNYLAGYAAANYGKTTFRYVAAHINVPYLDCNGVTAPHGATAGEWVGLGLTEATGINADCSGTTATYSAWWTLAGSSGSPGITVHPGDGIALSVYYSTATRELTASFSDSTDGQHFTRTLACPQGTTCTGKEADAMTRTYPQAGQYAYLPLAGFQAAAFDNVRVTNTAGTHKGGLKSGYWTTYRWTMTAGAASGNPLNYDITGNPMTAGTVLAKATPLYKSGFLVYWMPANAG